MFESSANKRRNNLWDTFARSLMYKRNNNGPIIEPCGTPHKTVS